MSDQIKVTIRVRPLIQREETSQMQINWTVENDVIKSVDKTITNKSTLGNFFQFDKVFDASCSNRHVYSETVQPIVKAAMQGFNGTVFAYGQTSSGKTYTIMGCDEQWGVIPYSIAEIFEIIENTTNREFLLRVSYMEIYNETVTDLLSGQTRLKVKECAEGEVFVADLKEEIIRTPEAIFTLLENGEAKRQYGETAMNDRSSRSHTIFRIVIESRELKNEENAGEVTENEGVVVVSHLNIVDLAGSERTGQSGATGTRFKEGCAINTSLSTLSNVVSQLSNQASFVSFRDSILTRILQNSLGGNSKTAIICTVTPAAVEETKSTLMFASRAKIIKNKPVKNEVISDETMLRRCQKQINELKKQITDLTYSTNLHALQQEKDLLTKQLNEKEDKIAQLTRLICMSSKISATPVKKEVKTAMRNRRITWCPGARNLNRSMPVFSPVRFQRPGLDFLCDKEEEEEDGFVNVSSSFSSADKADVFREAEHERGVNDELSDSFFELPKFQPEHVNRRRVKFLTPVYEIAENREIACQTENFDKKPPSNCDFQCQVNENKMEIKLSSPAKHQCVDFECQTEEIYLPTTGADLRSQTESVQESEDIYGSSSPSKLDFIDFECQTDDSEREKFPCQSSSSEETHELANMCETLLTEKKELQAALSLTKNKLEETRRDCEFVSKICADTQKLYDDLKLDYDRRAHSQLNTTMEFVQLELSTYENSTVTLKTEVESLRGTMQTMKKQIDDLTKQRDEANKQCEELFLDVWKANKKTSNVEREMKRKEVMIENNADEIEKLQKTVDSLREENRQHVEKITCLQAQKTNDDSIDEKYRCEIDQLRVEEIEKRKRLEKMLESMQQEIVRLQTEKPNDDGINEKLKHEVDQVRVEEAEKRKQLEEMLETMREKIVCLHAQTTSNDEQHRFQIDQLRDEEAEKRKQLEEMLEAVQEEVVRLQAQTTNNDEKHRYETDQLLVEEAEKRKHLEKMLELVQEKNVHLQAQKMNDGNLNEKHRYEMDQLREEEGEKRKQLEKMLESVREEVVRLQGQKMNNDEKHRYETDQLLAEEAEKRKHLENMVESVREEVSRLQAQKTSEDSINEKHTNEINQLREEEGEKRKHLENMVESMGEKIVRLQAQKTNDDCLDDEKHRFQMDQLRDEEAEKRKQLEEMLESVREEVVYLQAQKTSNDEKHRYETDQLLAEEAEKRKHLENMVESVREVSRLQAQNTNEDSINEKHTNEINQLREEEGEKRKRLESMVESMREEIVYLQAQRTNDDSIDEKHRYEINQLHAEEAAKRNRLEKILESTQEEIQRKNVEIERLRDGMNDLAEANRDQLSHSEVVVAEKNEEIAQLQSTVGKLEHRLRSVIESAQEADQKRVELLRRLNEIEEERDNDDYLLKENDKLRRTNDKMLEELHQTKMKVEELKSKLLLADEPWRKAVAKRERELNYKNEEIHNLKCDLRRLQEEQERYAESNPHVRSAPPSKPLLTTWASSGGGIMEAHKVYELENKTYRLSKTVDQLQKELFEAKNELENSRTKVAELENERTRTSSTKASSVGNGSYQRNFVAAGDLSPKKVVSPKKLSKVASESPGTLRSKPNLVKHSECKQQ